MSRIPVRRSPSEWTSLIDRWRASGCSARAFADQENLSHSTFYAIIKKYGSGQQAAATTRHPRFVEVKTSTSKPTTDRPSIEIKLKGGERLIVRGAIDAAQLRIVMEVLHRC